MEAVVSQPGKILLRVDPRSAPKMVDGSMTSTRSCDVRMNRGAGHMESQRRRGSKRRATGRAGAARASTGESGPWMQAASWGRTQSIRGREGLMGCCRHRLNPRLASVPPTIVMLLSATAPAVEKPAVGWGTGRAMSAAADARACRPLCNPDQAALLALT